MKQITKNTVLYANVYTKRYLPVEINDNIYWLDETFRDPKKLNKNDAILFTKEPGVYEIYYFDKLDGYNLEVYDLDKKTKYTVEENSCCKIVAQSKNVLNNITVINLDEYLYQLTNAYCNKRYNESDNSAYFNDSACEYDFKMGYNSNKNSYTSEDIEKAFRLGLNFKIEGIFIKKASIKKCLNEIKEIHIDNKFNIISYN